MDFKSLFNNDLIIYTIISALFILLFAWNILITTQLSKLKSRYKRFMRGSQNISIEQLIKDYMHNMEGTIKKVEALSGDIKKLKDRGDRCIQKCHIIRYNAFANTGSDLSYSIALLDNYNNGVILSSIFGHNESVTYAKPIESGNCSYPLSVEEEMVLNRCLKK